MKAGKLRHRVTIQESNCTSDEVGEPAQNYRDLKNVWARVEPLTGRELWQAQQIKATTNHRITMRFYTVVKPTMRVLFKNRVFEIDSVKNTEERNYELVLLCTEVVD